MSDAAISSLNCLIIAGEKSGEDHSMSFVPELLQKLPQLNLWGVGGDRLKAEGMQLKYHLNEFSSWGYSEVFHKIPFYFKALSDIVATCERNHTKVAILIDFQEFNLKLAKKLSQRGVVILYYVAPQAWVWKSWRVKALKKYVHTLFTILPFEKDWFIQRGVKRVMSVRHPLWNTCQKEIELFDFNDNAYSFTGEIKILLLPGSRNFEVRLLLPIFMQSLKKLRKIYPQIKVGVVQSSSVASELFENFKNDFDEIFTDNSLNQALGKYHFSFAASGTVTLSAALFGLPTIVCYKGSLLNEFIFRQFVKYKGFLSLGNIVHQQLLFPELMQDRANSFEIIKSFRQWVDYKHEYEQVREILKSTKEKLKGDNTSVAEYMAKIIKEAE